ncbi:MAG TPA: folylpolyglutamate synthase/dihydrofolate synthase family protein [Thermoanaerobaculia bacterium]|nr:folylpolyglutamate synthase/dihydrofolate synthase family protein [Thermoanaerobaculia bacterium]
MKGELDYLASLEGSGIRPGLQRMRAFLREAGHPERACPAILVAGTNGKGSTAAVLASILTAAGYASGLYTSPHLVSISERWMLDGRPVAAPLLRDAIRRLRRIASSLRFEPTYFEALTLLAFFLFETTRREIAVLEVGMGGRLDATNLVRPLASVITAIGLDHTEWLGTTVRSIAREKAGIIHRGSVAVTSNDEPAIVGAIRRRAESVGAELHVLAEEVEIAVPRVERDGVSFTLRSPAGRMRLSSRLSGEHQIENLALAARTAELLAPRLRRITRRAIAEGLAATRWRGRLEAFAIGGRTVWVDGGHNAHALRRIASWVERHVPAPRTLVFGVLREKDFDEMAAIVFPLFDRVIVTEPESERALPAAEALARLAPRHAVPMRAVRRPSDAIRAALATEGEIVICGSLYLAGEAITTLERMQARIEAGGGGPTRRSRRRG